MKVPTQAVGNADQSTIFRALNKKDATVIIDLWTNGHSKDERAAVRGRTIIAPRWGNFDHSHKSLASDRRQTRPSDSGATSPPADSDDERAFYNLRTVVGSITIFVYFK
jgi:hypothetical protein